MKQLKKLRFLKGSNLLDDQEMKKIRGGITCYIYDSLLVGGGDGSGSGSEGSGIGSGNYVFTQSCSMSRVDDCTNSCNSQYAFRHLFCICK